MKTLKYSILISAVFCLVLGFGHGLWASPLLPDLTVVNVKSEKLLGGACRLKITLANTGNIDLPPVAYDPSTNGVAIQVVVNNQSAGAINLEGVDPTRKLSRPHSTLSFYWKNVRHYPHYYFLPDETNHVTVTVDYNNMLPKSNERNNSLTRVLSCEKPPTVSDKVPSTTGKHGNFRDYALPDLVVTKIEKTKDCRIRVTIANKGKGTFSPIAYDTGSGGVWIGMKNNNRYWGSMVLGSFDRGRRILNPNGTITFLWDSYNHSKLLAGKNDIVVTIDTENNVKESNETNNSLEKVLFCLEPIQGPHKMPRVPKSEGKVKPVQEPRKVPRVPTPREKVEGSMKRLPVNNFKNIPNKGTGVK